MNFLFFLVMLGFASSVEARTVWLGHPEGNWATVILESRRTHTRDEAVCQSGDALRFYDALKIRAEAGTDAAVKEIHFPGLRMKCENVTGFGFVSCSLRFTPTEDIVIDSSKESVFVTWTGPNAKEFARIWDHHCAGRKFQSEDAKFLVHQADDKLELSYQNP
jgi:hypothetical protein